MADNITGSCELDPSEILVPDDEDNILPPGWVDSGVIPGLPEEGDTMTGYEVTNTAEAPVEVDLITGCDGSEAGGEECDPGYTLQCCIDQTIDYPPGRPAFDSCEIFFTGYADDYGRTQITEINNRLWLCNENQGSFLIMNKDGTLHKLVSTPAITGITVPATNRFGQYVAKFLDKVVVWSSSYLTSNSAEVLYVFDLDGNYLEYWNIPDGYRMAINGNIGGSPIAANSTQLVYCYYDTYNPVNVRHNTYFFFDYYGTVFQVLEDSVRDDGFNLVMTDEIIMSGSVFSRQEADESYVGTVAIRNVTTGQYISTVDRGKTPEALDYWGNSLFIIASPGLDDLIGISNGYQELGSNTENISSRSLRIYDKFGNFISQLDRPDIYPTPGSSSDEIVNWGYSTGISRYGNYLLIGIGFDRLYDSSSIYAYGSTMIYTIDGTYVSTLDSLLPVSGNGDQLGYGVYMDKDYVYMLGGFNNANYIKKCPISWI